MPIMKLQKDNTHSGWALWFITESEEELQQVSGEVIDNTIASYPKRVKRII